MAPGTGDGVGSIGLPCTGNIGTWGNFPGKLRRIGESYFREFIFASQRGLEAWSSKKYRILFSNRQDWEPHIRRDFRYTGHKLFFGNFPDQNLKKYDLLVPLTIADSEYLNSVSHLIEKNPIPIPSQKSLDICNDKYLFHTKLVENDFGRYVPRINSQLPYPYILKKKVDEWGANSHIILDREHELPFSEQLSSTEYFCQELITGRKEYTTHILFSKGKIVCSLNMEYVFDKEFYVRGKSDTAISCQKTKENSYLPLFSSILNLIGLEGLCCFNYKIVDNQPLIFEINPRFGASLSHHFLTFVKCLS